MSNMNPILLVVISFFLLCPKISVSAGNNNTLVPNQLLSDTQTLVSSNELFELGFFSPNGTRNRYLGIWYKKLVPFTVVWVANRYTPVTNTSGVLKIDNGVLVLSQGDMFVWSMDLPKPVVDKPIAMLLDSGNFVLTEEGDVNQENYHWQSFDHATDTLLPGMKLGWDLDVGLNNSIVSWRTRDDPSPGYYSFTMDTSPSPEILLVREQITTIYRSGLWNGVGFSGVPEMEHQKGFTFTFVLNEKQKYYSFTGNESIISRVVVDRNGKLYRYVWLDGAGWISLWFAPQDKCDLYKASGPYGICNANKLPIFGCVKGFEPVNKTEWEFGDGINGCARKTTYVCGKDDGFVKLKRMKLPDASTAYYNKSMNIEDCKAMCVKNCSCTAYAKSDIRDGASGCIFWTGDLVDMRQYPTGGQDLFVRVAASELGTNHKTTVVIIAVTVTAIILILILILIACCVCKKRMQKRKAQELPLNYNYTFRASERESFEDHKGLPMYKFSTMASITQKFSPANMLGEGGFGSVYKGILDDGVHVAVKRLSKDSKHGVEAFMKEVIVIAKLQHRNLVRLLGCCIDGEEKMLVYEYMSNKSLDTFLFDKTKRSTLDWEKRFKIIEGVAKGLLYLHIDSRLRIIHRDLKTSNILLDDEMNPKISDFGLAEIVEGKQTEGSTTRITGTPGYMAPEYATEGKFSTESDVFSYGVLVLEILSGRRNSQVGSGNNEHNILTHAWQLMEKENGAEFLDESLRNTHTINEAMRCLQIALLCVQENAEERPSIASVVNKLCSENLTAILRANKPGFPFRRPSDVSHNSFSSTGYESRRISSSSSSRCNSKRAILQGF